MRFRILLVLAGLLLVSAYAYASDRLIPIDGRDTGLTLLESGETSLLFSASVGEIYVEDVATAGGDFARLTIPGFHHTQRVGEPRLPLMNRLFEVPFGAACGIEIVSVRTREIDLSGQGVACPLVPVQPPRSKRAGAAPAPFARDAELYLQDAWLGPELVRIEKMGRLRNVGVARLEVGAVRYNPVANTLRVVEEIEFRIVFTGADEARERELKAAVASPFFECVHGRIAGARSAESKLAREDLVRDEVTLAIVTPPEFEAQLQDFIDWKTRRGFRVVVGVTGTAEVGSTNNQIRAWLVDLYNSGTREQPAPSFVLLVGDVGLMPTFDQSGFATDRPYGSVDGDILPDMYYGRFSASNASQLQAMIDKTLAYEQYLLPDTSFLGNVVLVAGMDEFYGDSHANAQVYYGASNYFNGEHAVVGHDYYYPDSGGQAAAVIADVGAGASLVNYTAHGSVNAWDDPYFGQNDVNDLGNAGAYCLTIGNCCDTAAFNVGECFGETWLRAPARGAIGYIGSSDDSYWNDDYWWSIGSGAIVRYPTYAGTGLGAYDGVFHDHEEPLSEWYVTNDAVVFCGNLAVMEAGGQSTHYWNVYHLLGDPSLSTWIGEPLPNVVTYEEITSHTDEFVRVTASPGSFVGITMDGEVVGAGRVDEDGTSDITLVSPDVSGEGEIVVMGQFREPFIGNIFLGEEGEPAVQVTPASIELSLAPGAVHERQLEVSNVGEPGSSLYYNVYVNDRHAGERNIAGSTLTPDPSAYEPEATIIFDLVVYNNSADYEWLNGVTLDLPPGVTVIGSTNFVGGELGDLVTNHATGDGAMVIWSDANGDWGNIYGNSSATATITLQFTGGAMGDLLIPYSIFGDEYGANPHYVNGYLTLTGPVGPRVTLIAPVGGEQWPIGETREVLWSTAGGVSFVNIQLSRNYGDDWEYLTKNIPAEEGGFPWEVTGPFSADCLVRVASTEGDAEATSDAPFMIYEPLAWLSIPSGAGICEAGESAFVSLIFDTTDLEEGDYATEITVDTNAGPDLHVPVTLHVGLVTEVAETPPATRLAGNWPNPFNPETRIDFSLAAEGPVRLGVFDVRGRRVRTLVNGPLAAGDHSVTWNGRDDAGAALASGLYLYRLEADGLRLTNKMVLAK